MMRFFPNAYAQGQNDEFSEILLGEILNRLGFVGLDNTVIQTLLCQPQSKVFNMFIVKKSL